jgi:pimeloyl-ACP methyl ester carboxylesterase
MRSNRTVVAALAALGLTLTGCASGHRPSHSSTQPSAAEPETTTVSCPSANVKFGPNVVCGQLSVPESHANPAGRKITIAYAVIHHTGSVGKPDPILWLDYGAGNGFLTDRLVRFSGETNELLASRDIVALDFRGTGHSTPALNCPELTNLEKTTFFNTVDESSPQGRALAVQAITTCRARLVAGGINLSAYNTDETAADIEDLRHALGYRVWNIVAGQYGTRVGLRVAQRYPATVRALALTSALAPDTDTYLAQVHGADQSFAALVAACHADSSCDRAFPDPASDLRAFLASVTSSRQTTPHGGLLWDPARLQVELRNVIDDTATVNTVPASLHGPGALTGPFWFDAAANAMAFGDRGLWVPVPPNSNSDHGSFSLGAYLSVACREDVPFADRTALAAAGRASLAGLAFAASGDFDECAAWNVPAADPSTRTVAGVHAPVLITHGAYDPFVPAADSQKLASELPGALFYGVPGVSAYPTYITPDTESPASDCARAIRDGFVDDPAKTPDSSCLATATGAAFKLTSSAT